MKKRWRREFIGIVEDSVESCEDASKGNSCCMESSVVSTFLLLLLCGSVASSPSCPAGFCIDVSAVTEADDMDLMGGATAAGGGVDAAWDLKASDPFQISLALKYFFPKTPCCVRDRTIALAGGLEVVNRRGCCAANNDSFRRHGAHM